MICLIITEVSLKATEQCLNPACRLLRELQSKGVQYVFGRINGYTDKMINKFDEEAGGQYIVSYDMADTSTMAKTLVKSITTSITKTITTAEKVRDVSKESSSSGLLPLCLT